MGEELTFYFSLSGIVQLSFLFGNQMEKENFSLSRENRRARQFASKRKEETDPSRNDGTFSSFMSRTIII